MLTMQYETHFAPLKFHLTTALFTFDFTWGL